MGLYNCSCFTKLHSKARNKLSLHAMEISCQSLITDGCVPFGTEKQQTWKVTDFLPGSDKESAGGKEERAILA